MIRYWLGAKVLGIAMRLSYRIQRLGFRISRPDVSVDPEQNVLRCVADITGRFDGAWAPHPVRIALSGKHWHSNDVIVGWHVLRIEDARELARQIVEKCDYVEETMKIPGKTLRLDI